MGRVGGIHDRACASARDERDAPQKKDTSNYKNLLAEPPNQAIGRSRAVCRRKRISWSNGHGLPLLTIVTAGQDGDSPMLVPLMERLRVGRRTRYDKCSIVYRAAVVLSGVVAWLNYFQDTP